MGIPLLAYVINSGKSIENAVFVANLLGVGDANVYLESEPGTRLHAP